MIVTVLWEDQRGAQTRGFGPHELLMTCVADDLGVERDHLRRRLTSVPKKGVGNVRRALRQDLGRLTRSGPVVAVVDRDKVIDLWKQGARPSNCMSGISAHFHQDVQGEYDLVFLVRNMETLTDAVCRAMQQDPPSRKPTPDERDRILNRAVWTATPEVKAAIRQACPSFDRIVTKVATLLRSLGQAR